MDKGKDQVERVFLEKGENLIEKVKKGIASKDELRIIHHLERYNFVASLIKRKEVKLLDAPCGMGWGVGVILKKTNSKSKIVGIDISKEAILYAKRAIPRVIFYCMDLGNLAFKKEYFDIILCLETLGHEKIGDDERVIEEFKRILKKGGILILSLPTPRSKWKYFKRRYDKESFKALIERHFANPLYFSQLYPLNRRIEELEGNSIKWDRGDFEETDFFLAIGRK